MDTSVPEQATTPVFGSQATTLLRWMVPSGQRKKPESVPSLAGTGTAPAHSVGALPPVPAPVLAAVLAAVLAPVVVPSPVLVVVPLPVPAPVPEPPAPVPEPAV